MKRAEKKKGEKQREMANTGWSRNATASLCDMLRENNCSAGHIRLKNISGRH